ncbi:MAG: phosphate acyltransferase, partial [Gammaproteobacteria bacterium]
METRIALDAMGGDAGAGMVVPAALHTLKREPGLRLVLVGDQALLEDLVAKNGGGPGDGRLTIHH